jgi:hypothetical protein
MRGHTAHLLHFCARMYCTFMDERGVNILDVVHVCLASLSGREVGFRALGGSKSATAGLARNEVQLTISLRSPPRLLPPAAVLASPRKHATRTFGLGSKSPVGVMARGSGYPRLPSLKRWKQGADGRDNPQIKAGDGHDEVETVAAKAPSRHPLPRVRRSGIESR